MLKVSIALKNPEQVESAIELIAGIEVKTADAFKKFVFEAHKYLIRVTPIDTGALRGGWTSFLDANQQDYSRQIVDISIAEKALGRDYHIDPQAIQVGRAYSTFNEAGPFDITVINSVPYGEYVDQGTSRLAPRNFVELARQKAEIIFTDTFTKWIEQLSETNRPVDPEAPDEVIA